MWWLLGVTSTTTSGPSVDVSGWAARLIVLGALAASAMAVLTLWRKLFAPTLRKIFTFEQYWPVLEKMAAEFQPNGGGSLRDQVDKALRTASQNMDLLKEHLIEKDQRVARDQRDREDIIERLERMQHDLDRSDVELQKRLRHLISGLHGTADPKTIEALLKALEVQEAPDPWNG